MEFKSYKYRISGVVQGVYYRKSIQAEASRFGYSGYVKNMSDGSVCQNTVLKHAVFGLHVMLLSMIIFEFFGRIYENMSFCGKVLFFICNVFVENVYM